MSRVDRLLFALGGLGVVLVLALNVMLVVNITHHRQKSADYVKALEKHIAHVDSVVSVCCCKEGTSK